MTFTYASESDFSDPKIPGGLIFEIPSGVHYFCLERTDSAELHFYHSSPGTGTRVAILDLKHVRPSKTLFVGFSWSPTEINLHVGPNTEGGRLMSAKGIPSGKMFRVARDGTVVQVDAGVRVMGLRVRQGGKTILESTALESWEETKESIRILHSGESREGYIFDTLIANITFPLIVTGFEVYAKRRLVTSRQVV